MGRREQEVPGSTKTRQQQLDSPAKLLIMTVVYLAILVSLSLASPEASPEALASPGSYASDYGYSPSSQYHAQDNLGQYNFGFTSPDQTKEEIKTADGVTRGAYSYVDANGILQTVKYISDAPGFRVAATNLPVHDVASPDVAPVAVPVFPESVPVVQTSAPVIQAAAPVVQTSNSVIPAAAPVAASYSQVNYHSSMTPNVDYAYLPYAQDYNYYYPSAPYVQAHPAVAVQPVAPVVQSVAPVVQPVTPVVQQVAPEVTGSQYHAQDEVGQYSFGYNDPNSVRQEVKTADGVVRGAYQYVDSNGLLQTTEYIADAAGFRVGATNLPQGTVEVPVSVVDTPEVAAAKVAHAQAYAEAHAAASVQPEEPIFTQPQPDLTPITFVQPPISVVDTPEVAAAKIAHAKAHAEADAAAAIQPEDLSLYDTPVTYEQEPTQTLVNLRTDDAGHVEAAPGYSQVFIPAPAPTPVVQTAAPVPVAQAASVVPATQESQYHAQDDWGQYNYGYSDGNSIKQEVKSADGVTRGSYSYVDANGLVQTVNYISDALGFRVAATNLPVHNIDTPVQAAPAVAPVETAVPVTADPLPLTASIATQPKAIAFTPQVNYAYLPYATNYGYHETPQAVAVQPAAPVVTTNTIGEAVDGANSQFHAQDDIGQYNYGFSHPSQIKQEVKTADGVTRGGYSYVDANGIVQTVNYISDAMGFRVAATNLPVHVVDTPVEAPVAPVASVAPVGTATAPVIPATYAATPVAVSAPAPVVVASTPTVEGSQFHAQDDIGQYNYGYSDGNSVKQEIKTTDGVVRGAYSYIDADGLTQTVNYIADALGFRVGATNLPVNNIGAVDAPVEPVAPVESAAYIAPVAPAAPVPAQVISPEVNYAYLPYATNYAYSQPIAYAEEPT